jgi:L-threonylcarbamoyladenylate synthase
VTTEIAPAGDPAVLEKALSVLQAGGLVAFPTDTVYGLGTFVHNTAGIQELYAVKERSPDKAIAVLVSSLAQLTQITTAMSEMARKFAAAFWPGPLTLILPRHPSLPEILSPYPTIGVRMPDHPLALSLIDKAGPMAVTSANISGETSASTAQEVYVQLQGRIALILDGGRTPGGLPSTVVDCRGDEPAILRQGPITLDNLLQALKQGHPN